MEKRRIGSIEVSVIGIGCNNFGQRVDASGTADIVAAALERGINFFDTADVYSRTQSETFLGNALGPRRKDVILATKFGMALDEKRRGAKPDYVRQAAEASLKRLKTDYIDLYQLHAPDPSTPIQETLEALNNLVSEGKVREIGCSNFSAAQILEADNASHADASRFVSLQNEYSLLHREPEKAVLQECERAGISFIPYFPLASGLLTGKYKPGDPAPAGARFGPGGFSASMYTEQNLAIVAKFGEVASRYGHTMLQLAFSWLLTHSSVGSVIAGAMNPTQVRNNAEGYVGRLSGEEMAAVDEVLANAKK